MVSKEAFGQLVLKVEAVSVFMCSQKDAVERELNEAGERGDDLVTMSLSG